MSVYANYFYVLRVSVSVFPRLAERREENQVETSLRSVRAVETSNEANKYTKKERHRKGKKISQ